MRSATAMFVWALLVVPLFAVAEEPAPASPPAPPALPELVKRTMPSVVTLRTYDARGKNLGLGSGFLVAGGRVVTNAHVVQGAARVEVYDHQDTLLGTTDHAESLSARVDLAVLPAMPSPPGALELASEEPAVGEAIVVFGAPQGLSNTVSTGIVSAWREHEGRRLVQISAPISQGSSGGPVVDPHGRVLAVSVAVLRDAQNLNFAVPVRDLRALLGSPPGRIPFPRAGPVAAAVEEEEAAESAGAVSGFLRRRTLLVPGEPVEGELDEDDVLLDEGKRADVYYFEARRGEVYTLVAASDAFDVTIGAAGVGPDGKATTLGFDDDSGGGTNARLVLTAERTGPVGVFVSSAVPGGLGRYRVGLLTGEFPRRGRTESAGSAGSAGPSTTRPAEASDRWVTLDRSFDRTVRWDTQSLMRTREGRLRVWKMIDFAEPQELDGLRFESVKLQLEVDCRGRRNRMLTVVQYSRGTSVGSHSEPKPSWDDWVPESLGEELGLAVCARLPL